MLPNRFSHGVLEKVIFYVSLQVSPGVAVFSSWPISLGKRVSISHGAHFDGLGQTKYRESKRKGGQATPTSPGAPGEKGCVPRGGWRPGAPGANSERNDLPMVHRAVRLGKSRV